MNEYGALLEWYWQQSWSADQKTCLSSTLSTINPSGGTILQLNAKNCYLLLSHSCLMPHYFSVCFKVSGNCILFSIFIGNLPWQWQLLGSLCQQIQQFLVVHVIQGVDVNAQCIGNTHHVQSEWLQKFDEVHFLSSKWVGKPGTGVVALWPWTAFYEVVGAVYQSSLHPGIHSCSNGHCVIISVVSVMEENNCILVQHMFQWLVYLIYAPTIEHCRESLLTWQPLCESSFIVRTVNEPSSKWTDSLPSVSNDIWQIRTLCYNLGHATASLGLQYTQSVGGSSALWPVFVTVQCWRTLQLSTRGKCLSGTSVIGTQL